MHPNRRDILGAIANQQPGPMALPLKISEIYASNIFSQKEMQARLDAASFEALKKVMAGDASLDSKLAQSVADAVKSWALSRGVTHFTHWFQPWTGSTAEKHDSFISYDGAGGVIEKFSAGQLSQSEPDASSFPSGGMRSTFEARGYTAWDASSPMFIVERAGAKVLCIPSVFVTYTGHAMDSKTGLLRSIDAVGDAALGLLRALGDSKTTRVSTTIGCEQEYFLIDSRFVSARPDLLLCGRTLLGGDMPKGQQLEDHYFGSIPSRVQAFMVDLESELYRLGVPVKTRHNEVAPSQFEMAPIFEESNLASDHNMLAMEVMRKVAERHGFVCLLHEKPFAGINGSGKHCNWSMATDHGENLLEPGATPQNNLRFLAVLTSVLWGVFRNQVLLRSAIASHGNDHRLGANEAPPAIISAFLGSTLSGILDAIEKGQDLSKMSPEKARIEFGLNRLPSIPKDNTDRNRTSPFAFTGNKFEFRAVGSSQAIAFPMTVLNSAVAVGLKSFVSRLKARVTPGVDPAAAALDVVREMSLEARAIRFEGDGYSEGWRQEAAKRGLFQLMNTPAALEAVAKKEAHQSLIDSQTFSEEEFHAFLEIQWERYVKHLTIEADVLLMMVRQCVIPATTKTQSDWAGAARAIREASLSGDAGNAKMLAELLGRLNLLGSELLEGSSQLEQALSKAQGMGSHSAVAQEFGARVVPAMAALRSVCDRLEAMIPDENWALPKYREMLFIR